MRLLTGLACLLLLTGVSGCDSGPDEPPDSTGGTTPTQSVTDSRPQVRRATQEVLQLMVSPEGPLAAAAPVLAFANGSYTGCDDDLVTWSYNTHGRVNLKDAPTGLKFLGPLRRALEIQGWVYDPHPVAADAATSLTARKGAFLLRVSASAAQPLLLVEVLGPCSQPSAAASEDLKAHRRSEPIELP